MTDVTTFNAEVLKIGAGLDVAIRQPFSNCGDNEAIEFYVVFGLRDTMTFLVLANSLWRLGNNFIFGHHRPLCGKSLR